MSAVPGFGMNRDLSMDRAIGISFAKGPWHEANIVRQMWAKVHKPGGFPLAHQPLHLQRDRAIMKFSVTFHGRRNGALGICYFIIADVEADDESEVLSKLYVDYEHLSNVRIGNKYPFNEPWGEGNGWELCYPNEATAWYATDDNTVTGCPK